MLGAGEAISNSLEAITSFACARRDRSLQLSNGYTGDTVAARLRDQVILRATQTFSTEGFLTQEAKEEAESLLEDDRKAVIAAERKADATAKVDALKKGQEKKKKGQAEDEA